VVLSLALGALIDAGRGRGRARPLPPTARGGLADLILPLHAGVYVLDASSDFTGAGLSFRVAGEGVAIDPATGALSIATDRLAAGVTVTVTATNPGGTAVSRFRLTVVALDTAPALVAAPALAGSGTVGAPVTVDPGVWDGAPAPALALQWLLDGAAIPGATEASYTPRPEDDGRAVACRVTATNPAGIAEATTPAVPVVQAAPTATGLAGLVRDAGTGPATVEAAAGFAGAGLSYAVSGAGATIDSSSGRVTIATDAVLDAEVTVTATNSGGSASASFRAIVRATPPVAGTPALAGGGTIGVPVTVDPGAWGGIPAPSLARQWLIGGAAIPGATAASYTPRPADDGKPLVCRVTGTNPAGTAAATSPAVPVAQAAPTATGLADLVRDAGTGPAIVDAAAGFTGAALSYAVSGAGATIDGAGRVTIATDAVLDAEVTVTATNSGGSASARFRARVRATMPVPATPTLAGSGVVGTPVTVDPGAWGGIPAPSLARQWLIGGAAIPGATGPSYTPVPADAGRLLACRITGTNPAGSAAAVATAVAVTAEPPATTLYQKVTLRSKEQAALNARGGCGYQFYRAVGYSQAKPNRIVMVGDVLIPMLSESFGDLWEMSPSTDLLAGRSGEGCRIDSQDGARVLVMHSASSQRGPNGSPNAWDAVAGIYLSTDGGRSWALKQQMDYLAGSGEKASDSRFSRNALLEVPGGTPTTRKWYAFQRRCPKNSMTLNTQIWRSLNGGETWHKSASGWTGPLLDAATYGENVHFLARKAATGWYYLGSEKGLFLSKNECQSWTKLNAPSGTVSDIDLGGAGGEVWICVQGAARGVYRHTGNGEGALGTWSQKLTGADYHCVRISPHNRSCVVVCGDNGVQPKRSLNGGTSWDNIATEPYPGQPNAFAHKIHGSHAQFVFHATDPKLCFAIGFQHHMICRDIQAAGGAKFVYSSHGFDCHDVQNAAEDPASPGNLLLNATDRLAVWCNGSYVQDSTNDDAFESAVQTIIGSTGHVGGAGGAVWLRSPDGTKQAKLCCVTPSQTKLGTLVRFVAGGGNPIGTGTAISNIAPYATEGNSGIVDHARPSHGVLGRWYVELGNNDALDIVNTGLECFGFDAQGRIYGCAMGTKIIKRAAFATPTGFSNFVTCATEPAPYDGSLWFEVDQNHDNRLIYPDEAGRLHRVTGAPGSQSDVVIFDLRDHLAGMPAGWAYKLFRCRIDPDPARARIAYVSAYIYGKPCVWRTLDFTAATVAWTDITGELPKMPTNISILSDGTAFMGSLGGTHVISKPSAASAFWTAVRGHNDQTVAQ
jgi:hypothetical protein